MSWDEMYEGTPPWDIGRPQPVFVQLVESGVLRDSPVLDIGCGTGENALMLAAKGFDVTGADFTAKAIEKAKRKAKARGLNVPFVVQDALDLAAMKKTFAAVIDSGLFHTFTDRDRVRYRNQLHAVIRPGGHYFMMCFSEKEPSDWDGPRRVTKPEIRKTFAPPKFRVQSVEDKKFATTMHDDGGYAYLATVERV